ncbi:hypothetical protein MELB17_16623 [Marinobacter sp. ELB17]|nr:hypothetical protein MELB17_16623 [Marinobacter sp. ELB17]
MDHPVAGMHPLGVSHTDGAGVLQMILVGESPLEHIGQCLNAPVWMGREAANVIVGTF